MSAAGEDVGSNILGSYAERAETGFFEIKAQLKGCQMPQLAKSIKDFDHLAIKLSWPMPGRGGRVPGAPDTGGINDGRDPNLEGDIDEAGAIFDEPVVRQGASVVDEGNHGGRANPDDSKEARDLGILPTLALNIEGEDMPKVKARGGIERSLGWCVPGTADPETGAWIAEGRDPVSGELEAEFAARVSRTRRGDLTPAELPRTARVRIQADAVAR